MEQRTNDKLLEKINWFKTNQKRKAEDNESKFKYNPPVKRRKKGSQQNKVMKNQVPSKIKAVIFVPFTKHSELATRLMDNEEKMEQLTGYRLKIVERGGTKLVDILHKANPWAGEDCKRMGCLLCTTKKMEGKKNGQDCKKRNCVYKTNCITCRERQDRDIEQRMEGQGAKKVEEEKRKARRYI